LGSNLIHIVYSNIASSFRQDLRRSLANAARRPSNQSHFAPEIHLSFSSQVANLPHAI
jgi:hypothetical protein